MERVMGKEDDLFFTVVKTEPFAFPKIKSHLNDGFLWRPSAIHKGYAPIKF